MDESEQPAPAQSLREALQASGARPNSRLSAVSRFMFDRYDELHALKVVEGYSWRDIVAVLVKPDFMDDPSETLTVATAKLAWSRTNQRRRKEAATRLGTTQQPRIVSQPESDLRAVAPRDPADSGKLPSQEPSSQNREDAKSDPAPEFFSIRPAHPRSTPFAPNAEKCLVESAGSLLEEDEVKRRIADLAARQGGPKIRSPEIL